VDKKQRVQFDLSEDMLEILDALKARTDVSTRAEAVRNAIKFHYDHLPTGPRRLVLGTVTPVPNETQSIIELRLGDVAHHLCTAGFKREEVLQDPGFSLLSLCLSF